MSLNPKFSVMFMGERYYADPATIDALEGDLTYFGNCYSCFDKETKKIERIDPLHVQALRRDKPK